MWLRKMVIGYSRRWAKAQTYEKSHWQRIANQIIRGAGSQLTWYEWKAKEMERSISRYLDMSDKHRRVLEVGSGPIGIVNYLQWAEQRYALDPLENFYSQNEVLVKIREKDVAYINGTGEAIPFGDKSISLVIIDNVLDHVDCPRKVLNEINRVLEENGLLYFVVNIHTSWGAVLHKILANLQIDKGHPYTFTRDKIKNYLKEASFSILHEDWEDYREIKRKNINSTRIKDKVKAYSGLSEIQYLAICLKSDKS